MEENFSECKTGILIDIEDHGNVAVDAEVHCSLDKTTNDAEKILALGNSEASSCITDEFHHINLGDGLDAKRKMLFIPKGGWKTPSPKSMDKIWKEAYKIIDQLHSSPIESTEALLVDEDFPATEEGCFSRSSPESEKDSVRNEDSNNDKALIQSPSKEDRSYESLQKLEKVSERIEDSVKYSCSAHFPTNEGSLDESEKAIEENENSPPNNVPMFNTSSIDAQASPTEVFNPDISELADKKLESPTCENIAQSNKLSEPVKLVSASIKFKTIPGNAFKTPVKSSNIINKENGSGRKTLNFSGLKFPQSDKKVFRRDILGDSNKKNTGMIKPTPNVENSLKKNLTNVIPEKTNLSKEVISNNSLIGANRRNTMVPRTPGALQYQSGSREKPALCKTSSMVETPNVPKFIRRTNSFQTQIGKNSTIKKPEASFEQKSFISSKESKISNLKTPSKPSMKLEKSRMSISQIPSNGNTPLRRSSSFTKKSGTTSFQIPGPTISLTSRKISSVAESSEHRLKRPVVSTSSRVRFASRLALPSPLTGEMNDNLSRNLFPDLRAPRKNK